MTLAFQVAAGIVMAAAFLGLCYAAFTHRSRLASAAGAGFAPVWRHKIAVLVLVAAIGALTVAAMVRSDARRAVLNKYQGIQATDYRQPSPFLERYGK